MGAMTGMAWVRLLVGAVWLLAGLEKLLNPGFPALFDAVLRTGGFVKDAPSWFQEFMNAYVLPNSTAFAVVVGAAETAIGIGLVLGLLTNLSAMGGVFLGLTFVVDLGGLSIGTGLGSPGIFTLQVMVALLCLIVLLSSGAKAASVDKMVADRSPRLSSLLLGPKGPTLGGMTGMAWVRLLLGALWLNGGLEKLLNPGFPKLFDAVLQTGGYIDQGPPLFEAFMRQFVVPNAELVAVLAGLGETAIGVGLLLGFFTNLAATASIIMGLVLLTSVGGPSIGTGLGASGLLPFHMTLLLTALIVVLSPGAKAASIDSMLANRSPRLAALCFTLYGGGEPDLADSVHPREHCPDCGAENDPQSPFCGSCGTQLASSPADTTADPAVGSDRGPSLGAWSMDRVSSLSTDPMREALLGSLLAAGVALLVVVGFYILLLIRWAIGAGDAPGMGGLVSFVAAHGGAVSVKVPPMPALLGIGGSWNVDPPITSIALLPFLLMLLGSWVISRRLGTSVLFAIVAAVCYSVILAVVALLGVTTSPGDGPEVIVSAVPFSAALHGLLIAGLGSLLGVVTARGPFLPDRARQVLRGALVAVGASILLTLVLAILISLVTSIPENPLGNVPQDAGSRPGDNAQPDVPEPGGGEVADGIRGVLAAIGGLFALLPAGVGTLWLLAHGLPVGLQNAPDLGDVPLVGQALEDVRLSGSLLSNWPFAGAWRLLLLAPVVGLVLGGAVAAHGAPSSRRWRFGALIAVPYAVIVLLTAILARLSLSLSVSALDLDLAFGASLAWALLILPVAAGLGAAGALLARPGSIPSAHPRWVGITTVAACAILLLGTAPLVASSSSDVPAPEQALASPSAITPESDAPLPGFEDLPSGVEDVAEAEPPPAPEVGSPDEPQESQDTAASPEQRFIARYYAAVEREDWDATYSLLDSASKSQFTREEWVRKQQARQAARNDPPIQAVTIRNPSDAGGSFTATIELTHTDGTKTLFYGFEVTQEGGTFRRHLTSKELEVLKGY